MAKQIAKLLKSDLNTTSNLAMIAKMLEKKGRANDTILAHITQREAEMLKERGGAGTVNPETGLLEFYDGYTPDYVPAQSEMNVASQEFQPKPDVQVATGREVASVIAGVPASADVSASPVAAPIEGRYSYGDAGSYGLQLPPTGQYPLADTSVGLQAPRDAFAAGTLPYSPVSGAGYRTDLTQVAPPAAAEGAPVAEKPWYDKLTTDQLVRLGLTGGLSVLGAQKARAGAKQAKEAAQEQKAVGAPYQAKGAELQRAAQAGELSPTGQQSLQALQARLAQGVESRGGVGVQQAAAQAEAYRQQLLSQQYNLGLQVSQIGDNIALGAIRTGLQADQALNQASTGFYTQLAMIGAGIPMYSTTAPRS